MTTLQKVLLTILLAVAAVLLLGNGPHWREHLVEVDSPNNPTGDTDIDYLQRAFVAYNHEYFHDRLIMPTFDLDEEKEAATTHCEDGGINCRVKFNLKYTAAPRFANLALQHEMCHIKTWDDDQTALILGPDALTRHAKHWRGCMLDLDNQGAFRNVLIDFYRGAE